MIRTTTRSTLLFASAVTLALAGCGPVIDMGTGTTTEAATDGAAASLPDSCSEENPYVAVSLPNLTNPYYVAMKKGFEEGGDDAGFDVEVQIAADDDAQQLAQVQTMLQKQPCALALNPVKSEPAAGIVKAANDAGVPVFTVNVIVDEAALDAQGASIVQYLGADNEAGGQVMGEQVITEPDERPVVIRDEGFSSAIEKNPDAEIVAEVDGNVTAETALQVTGAALQGNPGISVVWASTGPATYGALQAVGGRDDVKVYGFCASEEPLEGAYAGCVAQEPEKYGSLVTEQIRTYVDGGEVEPEILLPLKQFGPGETPAPGEVG